MSELSGQVAIVTGSASGIGAAAAVLLQDAGATVIVADLQQAKAGAGRFVQHDVASEQSWQSLRHCHVGACEPFLASARAC